MSFRNKLELRVAATHSLLCVGLDPHISELFPTTAVGAAAGATTPTSTSPPLGYDHLSEQVRCDAAFTFCHTLIMATIPYAACYKPNVAFFEALGDGGLAVLRRIVQDSIPADIPVLLDVKRGDSGSTAEAYASACYDYIGADAVTLSPFMGWDSVRPFVTNSYSNKGAFLLCKTSNPGSNDFLALRVREDPSTTRPNNNKSNSNDEFLYERVARLVGTDWTTQTAPETLLGLVVGATDPVALEKARKAAGDHVWILAPGVGAQGGELAAAVKAGLNQSGSGLLIPVSRGISQSTNPAEAAKQLQEEIQKVCEQIRTATSAAKASDAVDNDQQHPESIQPYQRDFLEFSLSQSVLKFGSFVLKSGRISPYFFNAGLFATGAALSKLGTAYASTIMASNLAEGPNQVRFDVIFGPAYKGIPLGAVVSSALFSEYGVDTGFAYNRKEAKDHGEGGQLVGVSMEGKRVLIVDDVITAGTAIRESCELLTSVGATPVGVVTALDRAEIRSPEDRISAVQAVQRDLSLEVLSIVNLPQLQAFLEKHPDFDDTIRENVANYRKEYGV